MFLSLEPVVLSRTPLEPSLLTGVRSSVGSPLNTPNRPRVSWLCRSIGTCSDRSSRPAVAVTVNTSPGAETGKIQFSQMCVKGRAQWLMGRASDSRLREPGFESCAAVFKTLGTFFTLHCSSYLSCINEYLAIDSGGYVYEQPSRINCNIWLDASYRSQDGV